MKRAITVLATFVTFLAVPATSTAQVPAEEATSWLATGDSYSSGEGVAGNSGACAQSDLAYGPVASRNSSTLNVSIFAFTACTGLRASDYFGVRAGASENSSLWAWSIKQVGAQKFDVVTMTFGGNDIGFSDIVKDCLLAIPTEWSDLLSWPIDDCDVTETDLRNKIDALVTDQNRFQIDPRDQSRRGSLPDLYRAIADTHLKSRGQLFVLGYPRLIAPSSEWGLWQGTRCNGITRGDANMLGRVAQYMTEALAKAVATADNGEGRIVFIPVNDLFRGHELCGSTEDWINGSITFERDVRSAGFHPKAIAHEAEAELLLAKIDDSETGILARSRNGQSWTVVEVNEEEFLYRLKIPTIGISEIDRAITSRSRSMASDTVSFMDYYTGPTGPGSDIASQIFEDHVLQPGFVSEDLTSLTLTGFATYGGVGWDPNQTVLFDRTGQQVVIADYLSDGISYPGAAKDALWNAALGALWSSPSGEGANPEFGRFEYGIAQNGTLEAHALPDSFSGTAFGSPTVTVPWSAIEMWIIPGSVLERISKGELDSLPFAPANEPTTTPLDFLASGPDECDSTKAFLDRRWNSDDPWTLREAGQAAMCAFLLDDPAIASRIDQVGGELEADTRLYGWPNWNWDRLRCATQFGQESPLTPEWAAAEYWRCEVFENEYGSWNIAFDRVGNRGWPEYVGAIPFDD